MQSTWNVLLKARFLWGAVLGLIESQLNYDLCAPGTFLRKESPDGSVEGAFTNTFIICGLWKLVIESYSKLYPWCLPVRLGCRNIPLHDLSGCCENVSLSGSILSVFKIGSVEGEMFIWLSLLFGCLELKSFSCISTLHFWESGSKCSEEGKLTTLEEGHKVNHANDKLQP